MNHLLGLPGSAEPRQRSTVLSFTLKVVITLVLAGLISRQVDLNSFVFRVRTISWESAFVVLSLFSIQVLLSAFRWHLILIHQGFAARFSLVFRAVLLERFLNQAIPATVGGDAARITLLRRSGVPIRIGISSIIIDRAASIFGLVAMMIVTAPLLLILVPSVSIWWVIVVVGVLALFIGIVALSGGLEEHRLLTGRFRVLAELLAILRDSVCSASLVFKAIFLSVISHLILVLAFYILARSLDVNLGFLDAVVLLPPIFLAALLPISISGWGIREGGAIVLLAYAGLEASDALAASVLFGIGLLCIGLLSGFLWLVSGSEGRQPELPPNV